ESGVAYLPALLFHIGESTTRSESNGLASCWEGRQPLKEVNKFLCPSSQERPCLLISFVPIHQERESGCSSGG
ncbi:unnamed protein product, partial [Gulo gulo]